MAGVMKVGTKQTIINIETTQSTKEQNMEDHQIQEHKEVKDTGKMGQQETKSKSNNDYKEWFLGDQRYMPTYIFLGDDNDPYQGNYKDHPSEEDQYKQLFL
jgi:hypothetical protein